jgi:hypothetical protein
MPQQRDPASELLDRGARALLARAYSVRSGTWVMTRLADPTAEHERWARSVGLDPLMGPDRPTTQSGRAVNAHTRWGRAFTRALYHQHRWYGDKPRKGFRAQRRTVPYGIPLQVEWGRRVPARGVIPAGRAVRIRIATGGKTALRVVKSKPDSQRIYEDGGAPAGKWSDPSRRDWA